MKKLQVFISSTYTDLKDERQSAVEAILDAGHIPAGMELFKAGNDSQLQTIKRWIDESDVFLLILGGRYGSIEKESGKSYTQLEYEYAIEKEMPVFAVVLNESSLFRKAGALDASVLESVNNDDYKAFKNLVMSKIIKMVDDTKDIKLAIHATLSEFIRSPELKGWVRGDEVDNATKLLKDNNKLLKENSTLKDKLKKIEDTDRIGKYAYLDIKELLRGRKIIIPPDVGGKNEEVELSLWKFIGATKNFLLSGVTNQAKSSEVNKFLFWNVIPLLLSFDFFEKKNVPGTQYQRAEVTKTGKEFFAKLELEAFEKQG